MNKWLTWTLVQKISDSADEVEPWCYGSTEVIKMRFHGRRVVESGTKVSDFWARLYCGRSNFKGLEDVCGSKAGRELNYFCFTVILTSLYKGMTNYYWIIINNLLTYTIGWRYEKLLPDLVYQVINYIVIHIKFDFCLLLLMRQFKCLKFVLLETIVLIWPKFQFRIISMINIKLDSLIFYFHHFEKRSNRI